MDKDFLADETRRLKADAHDASADSELVPSAPNLECSAGETKGGSDSVADVHTTKPVSAEVSPQDKLALQLNACKMKPLPPEFVGGASAAQAFNRPMPIIGQALCIFLTVAMLALMWANHVLAFGGILVYLGLPIVFGAVIVGGMLLAASLRSIAFLELFSGLMHPLGIINKQMFTPFSACGLGDALQGTNQYLLAAACYGEMMRARHPLDTVYLTRGAEREYILSLAFAGKFEIASDYCENLLRQAEYLAATAKTDVTLTYLCYAHRLYAIVLELSDAKVKANELRRRCFEISKDLSGTNEARHIGILSMAEAYLCEKAYDQALPLLQEYVDIYSKMHVLSGNKVFLARAYFYLSRCFAAQGDLEKAKEVLDCGTAATKTDVSTELAAERAIAAAYLMQCSGSEKEADETIDCVIKDLHIPKGSVVFNKLISHKSVDAQQSHSQSSDKTSLREVIDHHEDDATHEDDPPIYRRPFADEHKELGSYIRLLIGYVILSVVLGVTSITGREFLLINLVALLFAGFMLVKRMALSKHGIAVAKSGTPIVLPMQLSGSRDLKIFKEDREEKYIALFPSLWEKLQSVAGSGIIDAVAYVDESGEIGAVQILGYFASVSRPRQKFW